MATDTIVIVGAGVAGLTLAYKLVQDGQKVIVLEKASVVGGLARSFDYDGYIFDIGPHRFHTDCDEVLNFIHEVLEDDYLQIKRKSGVWMFERYFDWPLDRSSPFNMPLPVLLSAGMDLFGRNNKADETSFKDYILNRYGNTLYDIFFKPYTEKFLKLPCEEVSKDWAVTGIERALIDNEVRVDDLFKLVRSVVMPRKPLNFIYPESGGMGTFSEKLKKKIEALGGKIVLNANISKIIENNGTIKKVIADGKVIDLDLLIWTGPVTEIMKLLDREKVDLDYLSLLLYNYRTDHPPQSDYQWCYYGSEEIPFNRISFPSLFNSSLAPEGKGGVCVEVTCTMGALEWKDPKVLEPGIRSSLVDVGILKSEKDVCGLNIERIPNAYPIYTIDYGEKLMRGNKALQHVNNLELLGRSGTFWYNNMDHSILAAIKLGRKIISDL